MDFTYLDAGTYFFEVDIICAISTMTASYVTKIYADVIWDNSLFTVGSNTSAFSNLIGSGAINARLANVSLNFNDPSNGKLIIEVFNTGASFPNDTKWSATFNIKYINA